MKKIFLLVCTAVLLSACSSAVKLDNVPVEDKTGTSVSQQQDAQGNGSAVGKGGVTSVDVGKSGQQGALPAGSRIVYFDYDSFIIKPEFQSVIEAQARFIKSDKARKIGIERDLLLKLLDAIGKRKREQNELHRAADLLGAHRKGCRLHEAKRA